MTRYLRSALAVAAGAATGLPLAAAGPAGAEPAPLIGTFTLTPGSCEGGTPTGSYLRMILPTGTRSGPFLANADSACADQTFTLLAPGSDGGLLTGAHQPNPVPAFDGAGNGRAGRITAPAGFFGVMFSTSTNPVDPQTGRPVPPPSVTVDGTALSGDLTAFAASWNEQEFNQGAPKPDGTTPGTTARPSGRIDPATGAYTLEWASQIEGGPFDRFTGLWHLEGRFVPAGSPVPDGGGRDGSVAAPPGGHPSPDGGAAGGPAPAAGTPAPAADRTPGTAANPAVATDPASGPAASPPTGVRTIAGEDGWAPPGWLVLLVAAVGLGAFGAYVGLERALRRAEAAG